MDIYYSSKKLEKILASERLIKQHYSKHCTGISNRLSELRVVNNLSEIPSVPPPKRHKLTGNHQGRWGLNSSKNHRIIIEPFGQFDITDLTTITEIKIVDLEDYH